MILMLTWFIISFMLACSILIFISKIVFIGCESSREVLVVPRCVWFGFSEGVEAWGAEWKVLISIDARISLNNMSKSASIRGCSARQLHILILHLKFLLILPFVILRLLLPNLSKLAGQVYLLHKRLVLRSRIKVGAAVDWLLVCNMTSELWHLIDLVMLKYSICLTEGGFGGVDLIHYGSIHLVLHHVILLGGWGK